MKLLDLSQDPLAVLDREFQGLFSGGLGVSRIRGGQTAANERLSNLDITGYSKNRSQVFPASERAASVLSPYIRHNILTLKQVYDSVKQAGYDDRKKFQDELYWQEYGRHLYARVGTRLFENLRFDVNWETPGQGWPEGMACVDQVLQELREDGWLVNQSRMWLASHWTVRNGVGWLEGQELMHRELIDGSRAANLLGWQWTVGAGTGKPYGFARWQVEKRAPGICQSCPLKNACPIQEFPETEEPSRLAKDPMLDFDPNPERAAGPKEPIKTQRPENVLLTIDSLGDADPALSANPNLPAVFVFNEQALAKLQLSSRRIGFYLQTLADLAQRREVIAYLGDPVAFASEHAVAVTHAPVPSFRRFKNLAEIHPYPWLRRPGSGSVRSFSSWRAELDKRVHQQHK